MKDPNVCTEITQRFFHAIDELKSMRRIRGLKTFATLYDINQGNLQTIKTHKRRIRQEWLNYLVTDFNVSALWLLTGKGVMFTK